MDIKQRLIEHRNRIKSFGIDTIGIFGSYMEGVQKEDSDIDLLISFNSKDETFDNFSAFCDFIEELFGDKKVDIVTKNGLSPYIGPKILDQVEYVQITD